MRIDTQAKRAYCERICRKASRLGHKFNINYGTVQLLSGEIVKLEPSLVTHGIDERQNKQLELIVFCEAWEKRFANG